MEAAEPETERALFERYGAAARGTGATNSGRITIPVSSWLVSSPGLDGGSKKRTALYSIHN